MSCMTNAMEYLHWDYGPSWWFPLPSAKGTDSRILNRIQSEHSQSCPAWTKFNQKVLTVLRGFDKDRDNSISTLEFVIAVMSNKDLNLDWVKYQVQKNPCMAIDNARRHFNGMLGFFARYLSGDAEGARQFLEFVEVPGQQYINTSPYKYLPRHMYNLNEDDACASAVEAEFRKQALFEENVKEDQDVTGAGELLQ